MKSMYANQVGDPVELSVGVNLLVEVYLQEKESVDGSENF